MSPPHPTSHRLPRRAGREGPGARSERVARLGRRSRLALAGILAVLALLVAAGPAGAWSSESAFLIKGHGWGHGIGMSQWGCYGYAKHGWAYKAILKHYYTAISFSDAPNTSIRVRLRSGLKAVKVSCPKAYTATGTGSPLQIPAGATATTTYVNGKYRVVAGSVRKDFGSAVTFKPSSGQLSVVTATDLGAKSPSPYRGVLRVVRNGGALMMLNNVPLESYLRGVVPHEVSASWPAESLKAQACAARAFALGSLKPGQSWDVYCDVRSQAYAGVGIEDRRTDAAVKATAGVVPSYKGKPILAFYYSCSGGHTENIEDGWPGATPIPYLKGVDDPYDNYGSLHDWGPLRRTAAQLGAPLAAKGSLRAVFTVKRGSSPRIVKAALIGSGGVKFMDGNELRMKLGLNSTWAVFTSMSINPAPRDHASISPGGSLTLKGRIYPALAPGTTVELMFSYDGKVRSRSVTTTRVSEDLGSGYKATYSRYSAGIRPSQTTKYYFASGKARTPTITVRVN